jgi:hypothetical protein
VPKKPAHLISHAFPPLLVDTDQITGNIAGQPTQGEITQSG